MNTLPVNWDDHISCWTCFSTDDGPRPANCKVFQSSELGLQCVECTKCICAPSLA